MHKKLLMATAALALMAGFAEPSHASLMLSISDGTTTDTFNDSGSGAVNFSGALDAFGYNVVTGLTSPIIGSILHPEIDLNSIDVATGNPAGKTLTIALTDTGLLGNGALTWFMNTIGGTISNGSMSLNTYLDCSDTAFGQGTQLTSQTFSSSPFSGSSSGQGACNGTYSMTEIASLHLGQGGFYSGDSTLAVPEPATIASFGAGLLGLMGFGWLRRRKTMV